MVAAFITTRRDSLQVMQEDGSREDGSGVRAVGGIRGAPPMERVTS
jgi:hypothetical protein